MGERLIEQAKELGEQLANGGRLLLFLDYDGTLADFAPNPDIITPDPALIQLFTQLTSFSEQLRIVILSGRRLEHIDRLLPVPGLLLAGTYGIEFQDFKGHRESLVDYRTERPEIEQIKLKWTQLIRLYQGFYLEDKGYAIALHAKFASDEDAREVLSSARQVAKPVIEKGVFRLVGGDRFLEIAPKIADKGQSVTMLLEHFPWRGSKIIYIGDDDKDEEAFKVVKQRGGQAIIVAAQPRPTLADERLENPAAVRGWLSALLSGMQERKV